MTEVTPVTVAGMWQESRQATRQIISAIVGIKKTCRHCGKAITAWRLRNKTTGDESK